MLLLLLLLVLTLVLTLSRAPRSDCGALSHILDQHHYAKDGVHAAAASMNGTCDVECGGIYGGNLQKAADAGLVSAAQLKAAARRIMMHRFSLGLFDPESAGTARLRSGVFNSSQTVHRCAPAAVCTCCLLSIC